MMKSNQIKMRNDRLWEINDEKYKCKRYKNGCLVTYNQQEHDKKEERQNIFVCHFFMLWFCGKIVLMWKMYWNGNELGYL